MATRIASLVFGLLPCLTFPQFLKLDKPLQAALDRPPIQAQPEEERQFRVLNAETITRDGDTFSASGKVHIQFKDYDLRADLIDGNLKAEVFRLQGNARAVSSDASVSGEEVVVDAIERSMRFNQARGSLAPKLIGGNIRRDLQVRGSGFGTEERYTLTDAGTTTCDLKHEHWSIEAKRVEVIPNKVVHLRGASLKVLGARLFTLPYMSIPLVQDLPRYLPLFGSSPEEGYYVKTRFGLDTGGQDQLDARFDLMTRLGFGIGAEYKYALGSLVAYGIIGRQRSANLDLSHSQRLLSGQVDLQSTISQRNFETSPQVTSWSNRLSFSRTGFRLGFNQFRQDTSEFRTENSNYSVSMNRNLNGLNLNLDANLIRSTSKSLSSSNFRSDRSVVDLRFQSRKTFDFGDAELTYNRSIPIDEVVAFFSPSDQTPILNLRTDTRRLLDWKKSFPISFSLGELVDPTRRRPVTRTTFEAQLPVQTARNGRLSFNYGGRFRQSAYSDDTAQFIGAVDTSLKYRLARGDLVMSYQYLRPQGFTPLSIDRSNRIDQFTMLVDSDVLPGLRLGLGSGFDNLERPNKATPWQVVSGRLEWKVGQNQVVRSFFTYDPLSQLWQTVRLDASVVKGAQRYAFGLRFDGSRSTFGNLNLLVDGIQFGNIGFSVLWNYNGYAKRFDVQQYEVRYDLHCTEAVLSWQENRTGFRNGRFIGFNIRLKAFPSHSGFGVGPRGQSFGGVGGVGF